MVISVEYRLLDKNQQKVGSKVFRTWFSMSYTPYIRTTFECFFLIMAYSFSLSMAYDKSTKIGC